MRSMCRGKPCRGSSKEDLRSICVALHKPHFRKQYIPKCESFETKEARSCQSKLKVVRFPGSILGVWFICLNGCAGANLAATLPQYGWGTEFFPCLLYYGCSMAVELWPWLVDGIITRVVAFNYGTRYVIVRMHLPQGWPQHVWWEMWGDSGSFDAKACYVCCW